MFIADGVEAGGGTLDVERQTTILLIGAVIWAYLGIVFEILTETVAWERWEGTIEYTFMAPLSRAVHLLGMGAFAVLYGVLRTALLFAVVALFFGLAFPDANWRAALILLATASASFVGIGMMTAVLPLISPEKGAQLGFVAQGLLLVVSGVYYPVEVMPQWMQWLATISPATYALRGHPRRDPRRPAACRPTTSSRCSPSARVSIPLGLAVFRAGERYAKRHGQAQASRLAQASISATARAGPGCAAAHAASSRARGAQPRPTTAPAGPPAARPTACRSAAAAARRRRPSRRAPRSRPCRRRRGRSTTGQPEASARTSVPWPPWQTTRSHGGIVCAYDSQGTSDGVGRRGAIERLRRRSRSRARARRRGRRARRAASRCERSCDVDGATSTTGSVARRRRRRRGPAAPTAAARRRAATTARRAGTRAAGTSPTSVSARESPVCTYGSGAEPEPRAAVVVLAPPLLEPARDQRGRSAPQRARPTRVRGSRAPIENGGKPGGSVGMHVRDERRHRHAARAPRPAPARR